MREKDNVAQLLVVSVSFGATVCKGAVEVVSVNCYTPFHKPWKMTDETKLLSKILPLI